MSEVYLNEIGWALGAQEGSVEQAESAGLLNSPASALRAAGFDRHFRCAPAEEAYHLALAAARRLSLDPERIESIVYATCLPENANRGEREQFSATGDVMHLMDFPASHLQADLGCRNAVVHGISQQACTGLLGSIELARLQLNEAAEGASALCVTADRFPAGARYEASLNFISDGAVAARVSREPHGFRLVGAAAITNGALARASEDEVVGAYLSYTCDVIERVLERAQCAMADIAWVVPQNTDRRAWTILCGVLGVDPERVAQPTLGSIGHMISGDNLLNLAALDAAGRIAPGQRCLLVMAGFGLNWRACVLEKAA